jgi:hypothetical protein
MSDINDIIDQIKQSTDYQTNKRILREKILTDLHVPYNGGMFKVDMSLLSFLATWDQDTLYLEDTYQNPIEIKRQEFLTLCRQHYQQVMNTWHQQHATLRQIRKI